MPCPNIVVGDIFKHNGHHKLVQIYNAIAREDSGTVIMRYRRFTVKRSYVFSINSNIKLTVELLFEGRLNQIE